MAILTKGTDFSNNDQVTPTNLDNLVDAATFDTPADDVTIEVNGSGVLQNKDGGLTPAKLSTGAPSWDSSSNVTVGGALTVTGGQIVFPAAAVPSANANTLDDYEEGTWTPSVGGTATYTIRAGAYTKIGNLVFVRCKVVINAIGTGSTYVINGLPFAAADGCALSVADWTSAASSFVFVTATAGGTSINIQGTTAAGASIGTSPTFFTSGTTVTVSGCYYV